jgi:hypothetical protein
MSVRKRQTVPYSITGLNPYPWIRWWYGFAAASVPAQVEELPLKEREFLRRSKLISIALLIQLVELLIDLVPALHDGTNSAYMILMNMGFLIIAALCNRYRKLLLAGLIATVTVVMGIASLVIFPSGGYLGVGSIPFIFLPIQSLMISVLLFPSWGILVIGALNLCITIGVLTLVPKTAEFQALLHTPAASAIIGVPITTQIICALISFIVITSLQESLVRTRQKRWPNCNRYWPNKRAGKSRQNVSLKRGFRRSWAD